MVATDPDRRIGDGPWGEQDYTYDGVGNRLSLTSTVGGVPAIASYRYALTDNRLLAVTGAASRAFTCDAAGNVIYDPRSGVGYGYGYNAAGSN